MPFLNKADWYFRTLSTALRARRGVLHQGQDGRVAAQDEETLTDGVRHQG